MDCPYCGCENIDSARFCRNCGNPIDAAASNSGASGAGIPNTQSCGAEAKTSAYAWHESDGSSVSSGSADSPAKPLASSVERPSSNDADAQPTSVIDIPKAAVDSPVPPPYAAEGSAPPNPAGKAPSSPSATFAPAYSAKAAPAPQPATGAGYGAPASAPAFGVEPPPPPGSRLSPPSANPQNPYGQGSYAAGMPTAAGAGYGERGCFGSAWSDLVRSPGWFGKVALLSLINAVPILNLSVEGYAMDWGREVAFERSNMLPAHFFGHRTMLLGLCLAVFTLLMGIFTLFCALISPILPIIGPLAAVVFAFFVSMFTSVGLIRMGVFGKFGAAFDLVADFRAYRKNLGSLFCASCLPGIIIGLIAGAIVAILLLLGAGGMITSIFSAPYLGYRGYTGYFDPSMFIGAGIGSIVLFTVLAIVSWYVISFATALTRLVTYRAMGYWVKRTVPEWVSDAYEEQRIYGVDFPAKPMLDAMRQNLGSRR